MERIIRRVMPTAPVRPPKRLRVAAYARVSMDKDTMFHSLSTQVSYYNAYIQRNPEWEFAGVYADNACTGTRADRPEFQRLLADCRAGKIDRIITKSVSRFARNTLALLQVTRELKGLGIDVYFEKENMHSLGGDGELMLSLLASFAQEESYSVSENCKWQIRKRFEQGIPTTTRMNGLRIDHGEITPIPGEAETVRLIFQLRDQGLGRIAIAKELNARGIPAKNGGPWTEGCLSKILSNEKYCGDLLLQKQFRVDHLEKKDKPNEGELPMYEVRDNHEAIVPRELFNSVHDAMCLNRLTLPEGHGRHASYPFSGKLVCAHCGKHYRRRRNTGFIAWQCNTFMTYGKDYCPARQVREEILEQHAALALGMDHFDAEAFRERIDHVLVCDERILKFMFKDGHAEEFRWQKPSRSAAWTPEKRARASERRRAE